MPRPTAETLHLFAAILPRFVLSAAILAWGGSCARRAVRRRLPGAPWDVIALGAAALFAMTLTLPALLLGAFGALRDWTWAVAVLAAFALVRAVPPREGGASVAEPDASGPSAPFIVAAGGMALGRMLFSLRNPPADWDSYHYHLPMIAAWMQSGRLDVPPHSPPPFGQYFPGGGELLEAWMAWSTGRDTLVTWVGILGLALLALAVQRLARMAGAHHAVAETSALAFAGAPGVLQLTLGAKVDHVLTAWLAIGLLFALRHRANGRRAELALALVALGLLPGYKSTGAVFAALVLVATLAGPGFGARLRTALACPAAIAAAFVAGGFWYARNALTTGNPIFPAEVVLGGLHLPGLMAGEELRRTTQLAVWLEGHDGHLTLRNTLRFFGPAAAACVAGLAAWALAAARRRRSGAWRIEDTRASALAGLALAFAIYYLVTPFTGLYLPAQPGRPLFTNIDNLRLLMPTALAVLPIAAAGLSALAPPAPVAFTLVVLWLAGVLPKLSHLGPGIALAGLLWIGRAVLRRRRGGPGWRRLRHVVVALAVVGAAGLVALVDAKRERGEAAAWDRQLEEIHNLRWTRLRALSHEAAGRVVATTGVASWWPLYGRDFSGHPAYLPVETAWNVSRRPWQLAPEARSHPDEALWRDNLARSGAAFVLMASLGDRCNFPDTEPQAEPVAEAAWCRADTATFEVVDTLACGAAYRVRARAAGAVAAEGRP